MMAPPSTRQGSDENLPTSRSTTRRSGKAKESPFYNANGQLLLYRFDGFKPVKFAQAPIGRWSQGIAFSRDGTTILVQNMLEKDIQVFRLDGTTLTDTGQHIKLNGGGAAMRTAKY